MRTEKKVERMRKALMRSNTRLLLTAVCLFQALSMLLISLQGGAISVQALILAAALPIGTALIVNIMGRFWPVDRAILIMVLLLCSIGIITLSDIAKSEETPRTQAIYALAGVIAMFIGAALIRGFSDWKKNSRWLMILCALALLAPWAPAPIGKWYQGARNWVYLGPISGQPSEFMKPVLIVILAAGFANRPRFSRCLPAIAYAAVCCGILLSERDLGAVLLYFLTTVCMYYAASSNALLSLAGLGMGAGAAVIAYQTMPYVRDRVAIWQNPWQDAQGVGYEPSPASEDRLGEFDFYRWSGWMFSVNGSYPGISMASYAPQDGAVLRVRFTLAMGKDIGAYDGSGGAYGESSGNYYREW